MYIHKYIHKPLLKLMTEAPAAVGPEGFRPTYDLQCQWHLEPTWRYLGTCTLHSRDSMSLQCFDASTFEASNLHRRDQRQWTSTSEPCPLPFFTSTPLHARNRFITSRYSQIAHGLSTRSPPHRVLQLQNASTKGYGDSNCWCRSHRGDYIRRGIKTKPVPGSQEQVVAEKSRWFNTHEERGRLEVDGEPQ
ncbi:hypothetical protein X797_003262 [Metarhizium robertsii]|uniref:Uncharacterized protein n=1 Tax=Metarhizium robertsii TaxID=568076 RepID=A0A0A1UZN8_9HYPO|nr:hypothetical protein X797_003262 [Metarhizium robertsii]